MKILMYFLLVLAVLGLVLSGCSTENATSAKVSPNADSTQSAQDPVVAYEEQLVDENDSVEIGSMI